MRAGVGHQNYFQLYIRLQLVRRLVHEWPARESAGQPGIAGVEEMLSGIQAVASAARDAGLCGLTSACLHVCERVEPWLRCGRIPRATLNMLAEWAANSELYLRRPHSREFATALAMQLNDSRWGLGTGLVERDDLVRTLMEPFL